ncbi:xylose isomerase-like protein [Delphinella strobiligena]|nr:xylose isomerase-like protein [Delphinella strobiligena]
MPPKRATRAKQAVREASSDLSSAPSDIEQSAKVVTEVKQENGVKRKRTTTIKDTKDTKGTSIVAIKTKSTLEITETKPPAKRAKKQSEPELKEEVEEEEKDQTIAAVPAKGKRSKKVVKADDQEADPTEEGNVVPKAKAKRKTKEGKEAEAMPLAARTIGHKMVIGAHVSAAGGVDKAILNSIHIGANAFALFMKSQRKWVNPPLDPKVCASFHEQCKKHSYDQKNIVPHGSYLVNLAHTDKDRTKQAYDAFLDDLQRCEKLGILLYNFHPGNCLTTDRAEAIKHLADNLNRAHKETSTVVTLLENMAAGGNVLGSTFEDLRDIISHIHDKSRAGVCLDTCHAFAGGYDLRNKDTLDATLTEFDKTVGIDYLRALHLNDSKAPFQSHRDLHANIGTGFLGLRAFHAIVNEPRFHGLPMVLETPIEVRDENGNPVKDAKGKETEDKGIWAREIKLLESLYDMNPESAEFKELEEKLQKQGAPERARVLDQVERKQEKDNKAAAKAKENPFTKAKGKAKGKKAKEEAESDLSELDSE